MAIKSPCIGVCVFDKTTGFCTACYRTKEEAKSWKRMEDIEREEILGVSELRRKVLKQSKQAKKDKSQEKGKKDENLKKDRKKKKEKKKAKKKQKQKNAGKKNA
jgi:predicted Fe-S protein YdhL (DUF1289 family)